MSRSTLSFGRMGLVDIFSTGKVFKFDVMYPLPPVTLYGKWGRRAGADDDDKRESVPESEPTPRADFGPLLVYHGRLVRFIPPIPRRGSRSERAVIGESNRRNGCFPVLPTDVLAHPMSHTLHSKRIDSMSESGYLCNRSNFTCAFW